MIGLLYSILSAANNLLRGQSAAAEQAAADLAAVSRQLVDLSAAVEHLRVLVEGDGMIAAVGAPAFTPTAGENQ